MLAPILSVIIPVYNSEKYLKRAIRSIIEQPAFSKIQLILVNDGSIDNSANICDDFSRKYDNIEVVHKKNGGVGEARNTALDVVVGKYVAFLDSDDWFDVGVINDDLLEEFENDDACIYGFSYKVVSFNLKYYTIVGQVNDKILKGEKNGDIPYVWHPFWAFIYKTSLIKENNLKLFPVKYNEDISFVQRCFFLARKVCYKHTNLYVQWSNLNSAMHVKKAMVFFGEHYKSLIMLEEWYKKYGWEHNSAYSIVSIISQTLQLLCVEYKLSEIKGLVETDDRFRLLFEYEKYPIAQDLMDNIKRYLDNPEKYYKKTKRKLCPKVKITAFLDKHNRIRGLVNGFYYTFIRKREKLSRTKIKELKEKAK